MPRFSLRGSTASGGIKRQSLSEIGIWMAESRPVRAGPNCGNVECRFYSSVEKGEAQKEQVLGGLVICFEYEAVGRF